MQRVNSIGMKRVLMAIVVPAALAASAATASAQWYPQPSQRYPQPYPQQRRANPGEERGRYGSQQQLFVWQGRVDREIRIQMNGGRASVIQIGNNERANDRVRARNSVPHQDGIVTVQELQGRGKVDVVQQPDRHNGYTTIVRLRDPRSGAGTYRVAAYWQPTGYYGTYGKDRGRKRGHDKSDDDNGGWGYGKDRGHGHGSW